MKMCVPVGDNEMYSKKRQKVLGVDGFVRLIIFVIYDVTGSSPVFGKGRVQPNFGAFFLFFEFSALSAYIPTKYQNGRKVRQIMYYKAIRKYSFHYYGKNGKIFSKNNSLRQNFGKT